MNWTVRSSIPLDMLGVTESRVVAGNCPPHFIGLLQSLPTLRASPEPWKTFNNIPHTIIIIWRFFRKCVPFRQDDSKIRSVGLILTFPA